MTMTSNFGDCAFATNDGEQKSVWGAPSGGIAPVTTWRGIPPHQPTRDRISPVVYLFLFEGNLSCWRHLGAKYSDTSQIGRDQ